MTDYLFDTPWWLLTILFAIGAICAWTGLGRGERRDKLVGGIGLAMLLAGLALVVSSKLVETDREQVIRRSQDLVKAVEAKDWPGFTAILSPDATVSLPSNKEFCRNRDEIVEQTKKHAAMVGSFSLKITRLEPKDVPGSAFATEVSVYVNAADKGTELIVFQLLWHKEGERWMSHAIDVTQIGINPGSKK